MASRVVGIWVSSTSFQKSNIDWLQQPLTKIVLISVKNWIFNDPFHEKGPVLVILVPGMIQPSQSVMFLMKWGCKGHWGHGGCWGCRGHWGCRGSKVWKITTEDFRVLHALEFSFILMLWKKMGGRIIKYHVEFLQPFLWEAVEACQCYFLENKLKKLKFPNHLKPLGTIIKERYGSFYPPELFSFHHFVMRHPVSNI